MLTVSVAVQVMSDFISVLSIWNVVLVGDANSLIRRKPKKASVKADHNIRVSCLSRVVDSRSVFFNVRMSAMVIGKRFLETSPM